MMFDDLDTAGKEKLKATSRVPGLPVGSWMLDMYKVIRWRHVVGRKVMSHPAG
jgi:hypothetical protein